MHVCRDHAIIRLTNWANPFSLISINILLSLLTDPPPKKLTVYISRVKSYQCWANSNIWKQLWWSSKAVVWRWADIAELSKTITIASAEVAAPHQLPWCPCAKLNQAKKDNLHHLASKTAVTCCCKAVTSSRVSYSYIINFLKSLYNHFTLFIIATGRVETNTYQSYLTTLQCLQFFKHWPMSEWVTRKRSQCFQTVSHIFFTLI